MQRAMTRLHDLVTRRRRWVLAAWLVLLLAATPFAMRQTENLTSGGFEAPGSGSDRVAQALADFDRIEREPLGVVLRAGGVDPAAIGTELVRAQQAAERVEGVELSPAAAAAARARAAGEPVVVVPLTVTAPAEEAPDVAVELREELEIGTGARNGVETYLIGQNALWAGMQEVTREDLAAAESTGFPIVLLILLAVFGSLVAALLPLALGIGAVVITGAAIFFLSQATPMSVFVTNIASMIGIGVAVDYSLFILARYREEIRAGRGPEAARATALRTSGLAVLFSGVTVIVSLAGLFLVDSTTIRSMATGAIVVVGVAVLAALTLLPALIGLLGHRAHEPGRVIGRLRRAAARVRAERRPNSKGAASRADFWTRWSTRVMRRPVLATVLSAAVMLTLAVPALSLEWGNGALAQFPAGNETRVGAELAARETGAGAAGPLRIVARFADGDASAPENRAALAAYTAALERDPEVASVPAPQPSRDGRSVLVQAVPRHDPESAEAHALLDRVRTSATPPAFATLSVGGATAYGSDFVDLVSGSMWQILLFVALLSYLVLFVLLRSVLLPLKAVAMNLLSVAAAYGVLVAIFQWGWLDGFLGFQSLGYISAMTPPLLLAVVFGLSMDYEVFLLSRIRERYNATGDTRLAVGQGLAQSAKTITSAALIMVAVFAVFAGVGVPSVKEIGVGLAVAIALDATLVRLVLVPAAMELMGSWNWWLPRPLAAVLPRADFEQDELAAAPAAPEGLVVPAGSRAAGS